MGLSIHKSASVPAADAIRMTASRQPDPGFGPGSARGFWRGVLLGTTALVALPLAATSASAQSTIPGVGVALSTNTDPISFGTAAANPAPFGIVALSQTGPIDIINSGAISAATVGIAAGSVARVSISNSNPGRITFGYLGLAGASTTNLTLVNNGAITQSLNLPASLTADQRGILPAQYFPLPPSSPTAVFGRTFGGDLTVNNTGQITGRVGIDAAVYAGAGGGASGSLTITNVGTITANGGAAIDTSASVVRAVVNNSGTVTGFLNLSTGSSFTNSGVFNATGTSSFGNGSILNTGTLALVGGAVTGVGANAVTAPVNVTLRNVGTFVNAGTINLQTGAAGNTLTINGNYFGGQNGVSGRLLVDASSTAVASNTTGATGTSSTTGNADRLIITGNAAGSTGVFVRSISPTTTAFSTIQTLVTVGGTVSPNAFTLAGTQNFGTVTPTLVTTANSGGGSTVTINAVPNAVAVSAPTAVVATRTVATQGTSAVLDRVTQVRDSLYSPSSNASPTGAGASFGLPAQAMQYTALVSKDPIAQNVVAPTAPVDKTVKVSTWARATGDLERRTGSTSFAYMGNVTTRDLGYTQETGALLGGVDAVISGLTKSDDAVILGVLGGYTTATVNLNNNAGRQDYDGGTVGAYATYLNGPLFIDTLFKVDLLGLNIIAPNLRQSTGLQNYSFATNVGYRFPLDHGVYVEPTAGLDYVDTQFDRTRSLTASTVPLHNGDALRGRIGARVGSESIVGNIRFEPSVTAYAYTVLTESNPSGVLNGSTSVTGIRDQGKARGEVQAALNVFDLKSGVSGFVRADMRVGSDLLAGGGRVGVRYTW